MRHIIPISGKDSLATALVQFEREPNLPYEFVFNPTGAELPDVFDWINRVGDYFGKPVTFVGENLEEIIEDYNYYLPSRRARYCTRKSKIEPFEKWIGPDECIIYYGIRADENRTGYINASGRITPAYPLVDAGMGINEVYALISEKGLKPPCFFWQKVYDSVHKQLGDFLIDVLLTPWQQDILFAWRTRANCYFCFNQRLYEWVGLLDHHPELFWKAEAMEHMGGDNTYTWNSGEALASIAARADAIREKRVRKIVRIIKSIEAGLLTPDKEEAGFVDMLATTSCGLFCGK